VLGTNVSQRLDGNAARSAVSASGSLCAGDINQFLDLEAGAPQTVRLVEGTAA
jgi:hypothetical protein